MFMLTEHKAAIVSLVDRLMEPAGYASYRFSISVFLQHHFQASEQQAQVECAKIRFEDTKTRVLCTVLQQ